MNKIRFMSIIAAIMIASVGMVGCKERPAPASSDDGEAVVTTTTTELVVPIPTTTTVTEPTTTTETTTTTKVTTTTKKAKVTTTTKATKKAKVTTTTKATKKKGEGNLSVEGGTKPKVDEYVNDKGNPVVGGVEFVKPSEKGGVKELPDDGKGIGDPVPGAH